MDVTDLSRTIIKFKTDFELAGGTDVEALLEDDRLTISWRNIEGNGQLSFSVAALPMIADLIDDLLLQPHVIAAMTPPEPPDPESEP